MPLYPLFSAKLWDVYSNSWEFERFCIPKKHWRVSNVTDWRCNHCTPDTLHYPTLHHTTLHYSSDHWTMVVSPLWWLTFWFGNVARDACVTCLGGVGLPLTRENTRLPMPGLNWVEACDVLSDVCEVQSYYYRMVHCWTLLPRDELMPGTRFTCNTGHFGWVWLHLAESVWIWLNWLNVVECGWMWVQFGWIWLHLAELGWIWLKFCVVS